MIVHNHPISWYLKKIERKEPFSIGMYGDGEWLGIFASRMGSENAEGTVYTSELCFELRESLKFDDPDFYFSVPEGLRYASSGIGAGPIDEVLDQMGLDIEFVEKDVWDRETRLGNLGPFIAELRKHHLTIVSNEALRGLDFLEYNRFIEVGYPNCFDDIDRAVDEYLEDPTPGITLVAMGLPAAIFVQRVHKEKPDSWVLDLGSIWDAFVGIGAQRGWRQELYADPEAYDLWRNSNIPSQT